MALQEPLTKENLLIVPDVALDAERIYKTSNALPLLPDDIM